MKRTGSADAPARFPAGVGSLHPDPAAYSKGILYLVWGRVGFLLILSVSVFIFNFQNLFPPVSVEIRALAVSIFAYLGLSVSYYRYRKPRHLYWFAFIQIMLDIPLWALLVTITGGVDSFFVFLFHSSILVAGVYCGGRGIIFALILSMALYVLQALLEPAELVPLGLRPFAVLTQHDPVGFFYRMSMDVGSMMLVAALTGFLVRRASRVGEKLQKTEAIFKDLDRLNEAIISLVPSGLIAVDNEGRIKTINRQAVRMLRLDETGRNWRDADLGDVMKLTAEEMQQPTLSKEIVIQDGTEKRIVECSVTPLMSDRGERAGRIIHLLDITDRLVMQSELAKMERDSALGNLAVGLAHEIRNPLGSISGSVEMIMQDSSLAGEDRQLLQIVSKEVRRINNLVASLLNLSHRKTDLSLSVFNASEESFGIELACSVPGSIRVRADRDRIGQVLLNLVKNACEAMAGHEGGHVTVRAAPAEDGRVEVSVTDEGAGIDPADADRVFTDYFTTKNWGMGLGLSVSRQIVEKHAQVIGYRPAEPRGSVFYFTLSMAEDEGGAEG
jgi:two-component system sensor histidine kinase PilS (NtrC family)